MGLESQQDWLVASDGGYGEEGRLKKAGGAHEGRAAGPARAAGRGPMELEREGPVRWVRAHSAEEVLR